MSIKKGFRIIILALVCVILLHAAGPLVVAEETHTCDSALSRCLIVAAFLPGPYYMVYCLQGYIFCKKYLE